VSFFKKFVIWKLCFLLVIPLNGWSQAQPAAQPDKVGRAVSGVLQQGMQSRGFAANDPRFGATLSKVSPYLVAAAGGAAAVTAGAVTAPAWVTTGIAIVIGTIVSYVVNLAINGLVKWLFREDGKIDESGEGVPVQKSTTMVAGGAYWNVSFISGKINIQLSGADGEAVARQGYSEYRSQSGQDSQTAVTCYGNSTSNQISCGPIYANKQASGAPASCPAGSVFKGGACGPYSFPDPSAIPPATGVPIGTAISHIPASDYQKQLNPAVVAAMADKAWQNAAAQPGYDGFPYPQSNPITAPEAQNWANANPDYWPSVNDFVSPNPSTSSNPSPFTLPRNPTAPVTTPVAPSSPNTPNAGTVNPAAANPLANLGADPGTPQPTLEPTPTATQILAPLVGVMPGLRNFQVPSHQSKCPVPEFTVWNKDFRMDAHCTLIQDNQSTIQAAFTLVWALMALFLVLSA